MKIVNVYRCIICGHQVRVKGQFYRAPCPKCNGPLELDQRWLFVRKGQKVLMPIPDKEV